MDFAYALHTDLGHRCRGARVDGVMVPLNKPLASGQTVEIVAAKEGGPSLDWLNPELGYLASPRSRAKVRAWFNAQAQSETIARGREAVEKLLQREGRTALKLDTLAEQLGFKNADALFEVVGKDEFSLRNIENVLRPAEPAAGRRPRGAAPPAQRCRWGPRRRAGGGHRFAAHHAGALLPAGAARRHRGLRDARPRRGRSPRRLHQPAPHGADGARAASSMSPGAAPGGDKAAVYPLDVLIEAADRPGLLRDISEVFAKDKMNVIGVHTQSAKDRSAAWMTFTVELSDASRLAHGAGADRPRAGSTARTAQIAAAARVYNLWLPQARSSAG